MNKKEFKRCMQKGLGRCVLTLKQAKNIEPYRDIVLWGCLHNLSYDTQCEGTRAAYIYRLASMFHDDEYFVSPTVKAFETLPRRSDWTFLHFCELLGMFAQNGNREAREALYQKYDTVLSKLVQKRHFSGYDFERDSMEHICIVLLELDGDEALLRIAKDLGWLFLENPHYKADDFDWLCFDIGDSFGKENAKKLLATAAKTSPDTARFLEQYVDSLQEQEHSPHRNDPPPPSTADTVADEIDRTGTVSYISKLSLSKKADEAERKKLAQKAIDEPDPDKKVALLSAFAFSDCGFPLPHKILIEYAKSPSDALRDMALNILMDCKSREVHDYAKALLLSGDAPDQAASMLITNYTPADKPLLLAELYLMKVDYKDTSSWHGTGLQILNAFEKGAKLPREALEHIYETTLCSHCRADAVREMEKRGWLTPAIIEELPYDCNTRLTEVINRSNPKP